MASVPIILLKEGTQTKQGRGQILSNISACCAVADNVRTTLGPRGLDKLLVDRKGLFLSIFKEVTKENGLLKDKLPFPTMEQPF